MDFGFLHLVADLLLQVALVGVGELGEVEVGLGEGGWVHYVGIVGFWSFWIVEFGAFRGSFGASGFERGFGASSCDQRIHLLHLSTTNMLLRYTCVTIEEMDSQ